MRFLYCPDFNTYLLSIVDPAQHYDHCHGCPLDHRHAKCLGWKAHQERNIMEGIRQYALPNNHSFTC